MQRRWLLLSKLFLIILAISCIFRIANYSPLTVHYRKNSSKAKHHKKLTIKGVIIFTNFRSGSTFVGELFNQHPDVFYNFEPLVSIDSNNKSMAIETLRSILSCDFKDMTRTRENDVEISSTVKKCFKNNICFRNKVSELCSRQMCSNPHSCNRCRRLSPTILNNLCFSRKLMAVKIIRQHKLMDLKPLFENKNLDLKILHLIRDPRGIFSSRLKLGHSGGMENTCNKIYQNTMFGLKENPDWLDGKYKLIRYEDVAINPIQMTEEIYRFVGIQMVDSIRKWIEINTQGKVEQSTSKKTRSLLYNKLRKKFGKLSKEKLKQYILSSAYNTVRYSNDTWQAWRTALNISIIKNIEQDCEPTMKLLGYNALSFNVTDMLYNHTQFVLLPLKSFGGKTFDISNSSVT